MATAQSRLQIIIDVLTGNSAAEVGKLENGIGDLVKKLGLAALAAKTFKAGLDFVKESTLLAARVDTLGAVTEIMGRNAGISAAEVRKLETGIQSMGITTEASRQALAQMMRAEIDLSKATDLARLAQDAAVISGENSSEAFEKLTQIIGTGNTFMARRMGLLVDFEGAYKKLADTLGKPVDSLTQLEKVQARTNEVMAQGVTIAGAYDAAMETGGKQIQSYARHFDELQLAVGTRFQTALTGSIELLTEFTDQLTTQVQAINALEEAKALGILSDQESYELQTKLRYGALDYEATLGDLSYRIENVTAANEATIESHRQLHEILFGENVLVAEAGEAWTRYGEAQRKWTERAEDGINATNRTKNVLEEIAGMAQAAADGMSAYFSAFDQDMTDEQTADKINDIFSDHLVDNILDIAAKGGDISSAMDALTQIDPQAAEALQKSLGVFELLGRLDMSALATGDFSDFVTAYNELTTVAAQTDLTPLQAGIDIINDLDIGMKDKAEAINAYTQALDEGSYPVNAMAEALGEIGVNGAPAHAAMGYLIGDLEATHAPADGLLERLHALADRPWGVEVNVKYNDPGMPSMDDYLSGLPGPKIKLPSGKPKPMPDRAIRGATGLDFTVPSGYPSDSFGPIWAQSGERVSVTPRGETKTGTIITNNYYITNMNPETAAMNAAIIKSREMEQLRNNQ